jgi:uncharacterized membrane protein YphA (DoxX/SURF4 family)
MNSTATRIIYWSATTIVSLMMLMSAFMYFTSPEIKAGFTLMGFHDWFREELAIAKILGAIVLLAPVWPRVKEWAYAGFGITFISAFLAHYNAGQGKEGIMPLVLLGILSVSYICYHRLHSSTPVLHSGQFAAK